MEESCKAVIADSNICGQSLLIPSSNSTPRSSWIAAGQGRSVALSSLPRPNTETCDDGEAHIEMSQGYIYRTYRWLRWNFSSAYRRLFTIVFLANVGVLATLGARTILRMPGLNYSNTITAASVNFAMSILMRNEHIVNMLFLLSSSLRPSTPLTLRRWIAKIYGYGGIHSGCAIAALAWYLAFAGLAVYHSIRPPFTAPGIAIISCINVAILVAIAISAHPLVRAQFHDWFECTHRFAGWVVISLFWAQTILMAHSTSQKSHTSCLAETIIMIPAFWCLSIMTICIVYPWFRLRRHSCTAEPLSNHAMRLHFTHTNLSYCSAVRLATNPLKATHAFAAIPNPMGQKKGFSMVISNAGDWTSQIIKNPPQRIWIKSGPFYGVLRVAVMFSPVLIVATGSGIGPCLSLFHGAPGLEYRVLWSTKSPIETYGQEIMDDVLKADHDAVIVDTGTVGRPDLVKLTYEVYKSKACEAVVVISNARATRLIVHGLETRGVPAYGPIFDS